MGKDLTPKSSTGSFVLVFVTLILAIVFMVLFLKFVDNDQKAKPIIKEETKTTTTVKVDPVFNVSLDKVIDGYYFENDYDYDIYYNGAYFDIKCDDYEETNNKCVSGSLRLKIADTTYGLFTYDKEEESFINRPEDYYFIVNREFVIVLNNKTSIIKFYDLKGKLLKELKDATSSFIIKGELIDGFYPSLDNQKFNYYACSNNIVRKRVINIKDNFEQIKYENVEDSKCNN